MDKMTGRMLRDIPEGATSLEANGRTYYIEADLCINRFLVYQRVEKEAALGLTFKGLMGKVREAYELNNERRDADTAVALHRIMEGVILADQNEIPALNFCALFLNTEDEDRWVYDPAVQARKIEDFKASGIGIQFFFRLTATLIPGFISVYKMLSPNSSIDQTTE